MIRNGQSKGRMVLDDSHTGTGHQNSRKSKKLSLHSLSTVESKFISGIPDVVAHQEHDLLNLTTLNKMMKKNSLNEVRAENLLQRIIPRYKPNSKIKTSAGGAAAGHMLFTNTINNVRKDKIMVKPSQTQPLKASHVEPSKRCGNNNIINTNNINRERPGSCIKINSNNIANNPPPSKKTSKIKSSMRTTKVRFDKKVTIHYIPSDEERGSFEWRKNLTRQGIYQAMLWKSELEKLEMEEAKDLIKSTANSKESLAAYGLN